MIFDIRNFIDSLKPYKRHKHKYHCPACDGPMPVSPKDGKYFCVNFEGDKQHLREIRKALTGENFAPAIAKQEKPEYIPAPLPDKAEIAFLTVSRAVPAGKKIIYEYSDRQWVERTVKSDGKKLTLPFSKNADGSIECKVGGEAWPLYKQKDIVNYAAGKFLLILEGEKCVDFANSQKLVATTIQGSQWTIPKIEKYVQELISLGVAGIVYHPDHDDAGYKKSEKWRDACAKYQLPYVEINPLKLNQNAVKGEDIADLIDQNLFSINAYHQEIDRVLSEYKCKYADVILKAGKSGDSRVDREISKDQHQLRQFVETVLEQANKAAKFDFSTTPQQEINPPGTALDVDVWFDASDRKKVYQEILTSEKYQDYDCILDTSSAGSGKSHTAGTFEPSDFGASKLFYISNEHRNPTTPTIETNFTDLPARNQGLFADENQLTPMGNPTVHWPKDGQIPNVKGNCDRAPLFRKLSSKGYQNEANAEAALNPICNTCKFRFNCSGAYPDGKEANHVPGNSFRRDRKTALLSDKIRCHIDSLPSEIPDNSIAFVDEFSRQINTVKTTEVNLSDFDSTVSTIATELPEIWDLIKDFISPLRSYLDYSHKEAYHGHPHNEVMQIFGNINLSIIADIIDALKILNPDLESIFEEPNELDDYKGISRGIIRAIKSKFMKESIKNSHSKLDDLAVNWLVPLLEIYSQDVPGNFRIKNHKLIIATKNSRQTESLTKFKKMVLLDATGTRESVALELGIKPDEILIICENLPNYSNLEVIHINDLGLCGKNRSESKKQQIKALSSYLKSKHDRLGIIDHLACKAEGDGHWFYDNRGSNKYIGSNLLAIGTPYQDLGAIAQKYSLLTGDFDISKENPNFQNYVNHLVDSEIIQMAGRPRAARMPDCKITVYLTATTDIKRLLDYYPGCTITTTTAFELCPYAGNREQASKYTLLEAFKNVIDKGIKCTQENLSRISGLSQPYISKISKLYGGFQPLKKLLLLLIDCLYSGSNNFFDLTDDQKFLINDFLPLLPTLPREELIQELITTAKATGYKAFSQILRQLQPDLIAGLIQAIVDVVVFDDGERSQKLEAIGIKI
jgi:hypothetical protein